MDRRTFFGTLVVALMEISFGKSDLKLRETWRYSKDSWSKIRMRDLKKDDLFCLIESDGSLVGGCKIMKSCSGATTNKGVGQITVFDNEEDLTEHQLKSLLNTRKAFLSKN